MNEVERIAARLRRLHDGDAWHGASVRDVLDGITCEQAAARLTPDVHTIWEILAHVTAWLDEVRQRLGGGAPGVPRAGDWPPVGDTSPVAWERARAAHAAAHAALLRALADFSPARLEEVVGVREPATGTGVSYEIMLHGLAEHEAYHSGQIGLLKKATSGMRSADAAAFQSIATVFPVDDVGVTARWYEAKLGFEVDPFPQQEPWMFAILRRDGVEIMLQRVAGYRKPDLRDRRPGGVWDAYLRLRGVQPFYERVRGSVEVTKPLTRQPYGQSEFEVTDPNGYVLVFAEFLG